jgi:hypothetical protein
VTSVPVSSGSVKSGAVSPGWSRSPTSVLLVSAVRGPTYRAFGGAGV